MDEEYDVIVLGTGLTECVLSGVLSVEGKKVLHLDRNDYYGGSSASLQLAELFRQFRGGAEAPKELGASRDYNVDIVPKFIMANGVLVKILIKTDVTRYLEFKSVDGSYVFTQNKVNKVPATAQEALASPLMGLLEKRRFKNMLEWVAKFDPANKETHKDPTPGWLSSAAYLDFKKMPMSAFFKKFDLAPDTVDFIGHALALHRNDDYLQQPAEPTLMKIRLYFESLARFQKSPYIYPLYGLGELPQAFARLAAIYGGTYMLHTPVDGIEVDADGKFTGVKSGDTVIKAKQVLGAPEYFPDRVENVGKVVRVICVLDHPIANTNNGDSVQIIIPQKQVKRKSDIYISTVSGAHSVCPKGKYVAIVSTTVETSDPEKECAPGVRLLGPVLEKFVIVSDQFQPKDSGVDSNVFVSRSFDATSHFETTSSDIMDVYKRMTGKDLDLTPPPPKEEDQTSPQ